MRKASIPKAHIYEYLVLLCKIGCDKFESVIDLIPEPRCLKFAVGLQMRRRNMGDTRGLVGLWSEGLRVMGASLCAKCLSVCSRFGLSGSVVVCE